MAEEPQPNEPSEIGSTDLFGSHVTEVPILSNEAPDVADLADFADSDRVATCEVPAPSARELAAFDDLVGQCMLSAQISSGLSLPWEQGVFRSIFGDEPLWSLPEMPLVTQAVPERTLERSREELEGDKPPGKRQKGSQFVHGLYDKAISFSLTLTDHEIDKAKWSRALEKLYSVFSCCKAACPVGLTLDPADMQGNFRKIRELCGSRSCGTILKRANSLVKYCTWHNRFFYQKEPFPFVPSDISEYIWECHQDGATYSTMRAFTEAVNFGIHVLGMASQSHGTPIIDSFTRGVLDKAAMKRPGRKQARPLTVKEVMHLEQCLQDSSMNLFDRYAAGAFLFAIYGRCRWSDLRSVDSFELDVSMDRGVPCGFISFATYNHKTAAQVARHGLPLALVAPVWGLDSPPWGLSWKTVAEEAEMNFAEHFKGPVLPTPLKNGKWGLRSVTASEASRWLNALLTKNGDTIEQVSSHSLKCTTLSWLAKAGANAEHRLVLGHHSSGRGSLEVYSRDLLAAPLRTLEEILRQIRVGSLQPDRTRSGILQAATRADCREEPPRGSPCDETLTIDDKAPDAEEHDSSSSSSSSDSSSGSDSGDEGEDSHWTQVSADKSHRQAWGSSTMYQHAISKIVHVEADSETKQFQCGIYASSEHLVVHESAFLETRKCKRWQRALGEA